MGEADRWASPGEVLVTASPPALALAGACGKENEEADLGALAVAGHAADPPIPAMLPGTREIGEADRRAVLGMVADKSIVSGRHSLPASRIGEEERRDLAAE